jgi:hypothetical protein
MLTSIVTSWGYSVEEVTELGEDVFDDFWAFDSIELESGHELKFTHERDGRLLSEEAPKNWELI